MHNTDYITALDQAHSKSAWSPSNVNDPAYDAINEAFRAATTTEEQQRLTREAVMYWAEQHWTICGTESSKF